MPVLDLLATLFMLLSHMGLVESKGVIPFSLYLITKGVAFRDMASIFDLFIGLYMIGIIVFGFHTFLVYIFAFYLVQKAVFGFF